jgi:meiosis-specific APC/C activator protein AMA1
MGGALTLHAESTQSPKMRLLPVSPFKVLDAPGLRDDFYCSVLAYSPVCRTLAVGLGDMLYGWTESSGAVVLNSGSATQRGTYITSVAFSSVPGRKCILAFGRSNGALSLMSLYDSMIPRLNHPQPAPISCLRWRPTCKVRPSKNPQNPDVPADTEDLLVGDEQGIVRYYVVEWPLAWEVERDNWPGKLSHVATITVHTQQICGLAWSPSGELFATGGNDNLCCLWEADKVLGVPSQDRHFPRLRIGRRSRSRSDPSVYSHFVSHHDEEASLSEKALDIHMSEPLRDPARGLGAGSEKHQWIHGAAVKAIAFCPWQEGLVATGGGSNDKCIHFFHTTSGAALATIAVSAQVTSLIWSTTRREIAATFGYAQPDHPYRIAVFSWPDCKQVAAIPWEGEHRALYAISYPGGPHSGSRDGKNASQTAEEGCVVVAASDESVKFHEVWSADRKATAGGVGMLGGSDILEGMEGIDKEGDIIR